MFCSKCNAALEDGVKFCTKCGANIELSTVSAAPVGKNVQRHSSQKKRITVFAAIIIVAVVIFMLVKFIFHSANRIYDMGETATLYGLEITPVSYETMDSIETELGSFVPDDGMVFAVVRAGVYNAGNTNQEFMDYIRSYAVLVYDDKEFKSTKLSNTYYETPNDLLSSAYMAPMTSQEGYIAFQIPAQLVGHENEMTLEFVQNNSIVNVREQEFKEDIEKVTFNIR